MDDPTRSREWITEAQKLLLSLRDIAGASISLSRDGKDITEINILAGGTRPPKQIVRDVRSALRAEYQIDLDYRKISVAQKEASEETPGVEPAGPTVLTLPQAAVEEEPAALRLRFEGVTVHLHHTGCEVQVEISLGDRRAVGEARGTSSPRQSNKLVAEATLEAVSRFLDSAYAFLLSDLEVVRLGGEDVILVAVRFYKDRADKTLTGSCHVRTDLQQATVYATLAALNRILGRLRYREPVEYELRPSSTFRGAR